VEVDATARFVELVSGPEDRIPLDEGALLIAAHAYPHLDVAAQLRRLDALAEECPRPTLEGLCEYLFADAGFAGNAAEYHDPRNSYLNDVLDRRLGIPISLSVLTIEIGRRLGLPLAGVGMPGHFLVRHRGDPPVLLDPFGGGRHLTEAEAEDLFRSLGGTGPFPPQFLDPVGPRAILTRMLANLQGIFIGRDNGQAAWVLRLRLAIPGLEKDERVGLARALAALGRFDLAATELGDLGLADEARSLRARSN
jgi:regulator of sirC expression with transglutaminase-like and TPR domain